MSSEPVPGDDDESLAQIVRRLETRVTELEAENAELRAEKEELRGRVETLEEQREQEPTFSWPEEDPKTLNVEHPESDFTYSIGGAAASKLPSGWTEEDLEDMERELEALKRGEVDDLDLVAGVDPEYPIENDLAKLGNDQLEDDLSANELRAAVIFRKFGGRSSSWSGTMKLESDTVKQILEEVRGEGSLNNNTVSRAMRMAAKKTSSLPKGDRDPEDQENNLLWVAKGDKRLQLRADKDEFTEYLKEVEKRFG